MCDDSDNDMVAGFDSSKTISWIATRESKKLTEEKYIEQFIDFIENEKNKKKRDNAYFVLSKIAKNAKTIPYEIMTNISSRVKRVYVKN